MSTTTIPMTTLPDLSLFRRLDHQLSNPFSLIYSPDAYFWYEVTSVPFSTLLQKCKYPPSFEARFLSLFEQIVPQLGPVFPSTRKRLAADGTPIGFSWNYDSTTSTSTVRFSFDLPHSPRDLISELAAQGHLNPDNADLTLLDSALSQLVSIADPVHPPYFFGGVDCLPLGDSRFKLYVKPAISSAYDLSHQRAADLIYHWDNTIFGGGLRQAYSVIDNYNTQLPRRLQETVGMLAWDCIHPLRPGSSYMCSLRKPALKVFVICGRSVASSLDRRLMPG